jgi:hypothetical protein
MIRRTVLAVILIFTATGALHAQQIQSSIMGSPHKTDFQTFLVQPLGESGNFTFTNLSFFQRYHEPEDQPFDELGVQGIVFWNFSQNFGVGPGLYYNNPKGLMPKAVFQTYHVLGPLTLITNPAMYYHEDKFWGGEVFAQATFIEPINPNLSFFGQLNTLTTWDRFAEHGRSYIQLRFGTRFTKGFQLGVAYDKDWYTPQKFSQSSLGLFIEQWF